MSTLSMNRQQTREAQYGELSPRLERSDVFPEGITCQWIDGYGDVAASWLCQNAQALYKQLHKTFGTSYAVAFCHVYRDRIKDHRAELDLNRWADDGGNLW